MDEPSAPVEVFCCYVEEDASFLESLQRHLSILRRSEIIVTWYKRKVIAGGNWKHEIDAHLNSDALILLLISPHFLDSDYAYGMELQRAMQRYDDNEARVIPILVRPCYWKKASFARLQMLPRDGLAISACKNEDQAFTEIVEEISNVLESIQHQHLTPGTAASDLPKIWQIPYKRNEVFTGREQILTQLAEALLTGKTTALCQPQAISGLGGIGKTQIAVEYAYQHRQDYKVVMWARADSREALISGYVEIASVLNLPQKEEKDQILVVNAVMQWLKTRTAWLLILDNADDLKIVREFLPSPAGGHILLTTRAQAMGGLAQRIEVEKLDADTGALLLLRRAVLITQDSPLEAALPEDVALARALTQELGGLPLALDQAGAYIEEIPCSLAEYQTLYRKDRSKLLNERGGLVGDHPDPVATTWSLAFQKVEQQNAAAADLLRFCAFLAPDAIPEEIFVMGAKLLGPLLQSLASDPFLLNEGIRALGAYSLLRRDRTNKTLSIHRLVQAVIRDAMEDELRHIWIDRTVRAIEATLPLIEHGNWAPWERLLVHALVCGEMIAQQQVHDVETVQLLHQTGLYLVVRARYYEAGPLLEQALEISEEVQGGEHLNTARVALTLAYLYHVQGKYEQAEPLFVRVLEVREQQLGADHPDTAQSLNGLAVLYERQGKYEQAEPLFVRVLEVRERQLGADHLDIASSLNNLAGFYQKQGKYEQAESLYVRALGIREQQLGENHPDTASSLDNLAGLYQMQGKYEQAEPLFVRALEIREKQLGENHPDTASSLNNLASLYQMQGKYEQAEPLFVRALEIREKQLGENHPDTASSLNNLASLYQMQGKYEQAEPLYKRALMIHERQLGVEHPDTATSLSNLAHLYEKQGKYEQAEPLYKRALAIREQQLEARHPDIAISLNNLARLYERQGKYEEAEPLYVRALDILKNVLGRDHPSTEIVRRNYDRLLQAMERTPKVEHREGEA